MGFKCQWFKWTVKCRQQWVGDDIAFCHWEAPSQEELLELFNRVGPTDKLTIELHEQWRFVSFYNQTDEPIEHKEYWLVNGTKLIKFVSIQLKLTSAATPFLRIKKLESAVVRLYASSIAQFFLV